MRTKTNERKRYSLRVSKKRDVESVKSSPISYSPKLKKLKEEEKSKTNSPKNNSSSKNSSPKLTPKSIEVKDQNVEDGRQQENHNQSMKIQKTKRKGKPIKSVVKNDEDWTEGKTANNERKTLQIKPTSTQIVSKTEHQKLEEVSESNNEGELPVYTALEHAIICDADVKSCIFPKCSIAKQFLVHCENCPKKENCTICKAMDIMVCKHAENCETPLEKCCPIPNCDRVRYMVLEEWVKLKHRHHDIMTQVFQGLLHAWKCTDQLCNSILCENIKTVLLHTRSCQKDEKSCRTKKFIVQLCEYHQQTCQDQDCNVEFCQENRKRNNDALEKKIKSSEKSVLSVEHNEGKDGKVQEEGSLYSSGATKPIQNFTPNNLYFPNIQPTGGATASGNIIPQWNMGFPPQGGNMFPGNQVAYTLPYMTWQPFNSPGFGINPYQHQQASSDVNLLEEGKNEIQTVNWPQQNSANTESQNVNIVAEQSTSCMPSSRPSTSDTNDFRTIQDMPDVENNGRYPSPTDEMYYQLWPNTKEDNSAKATLPRLSPNELQTILLSREEENLQMLSPVQNNRAQFSEAPILINEYQTSQESELDENPIEAISVPQQFISQEKRIEEMDENLKDQESWSKIDFIKEQNIHQGLDVDTETADEEENESVSESIYSAIQDEVYFLKARHESGKTISTEEVGREENIQLTSIEKNYLAILQGQNKEQS